MALVSVVYTPVSSILANRGECLTDQGGRDSEAVGHERLKDGVQRRQGTGATRLNQYTEGARHGEPAGLGHSSAQAFVDQEPITRRPATFPPVPRAAGHSVGSQCDQ